MNASTKTYVTCAQASLLAVEGVYEDLEDDHDDFDSFDEREEMAHQTRAWLSTSGPAASHLE